MANPRKGLGRGLSALIADLGPAEEGERAPDRVLPLASLRPNPDQPRRSFDEDQLRDLAASLQARGVIQPLIVRPDPGEEGAWQIVAGERRFRAAQIARLHEVPVIVRDYDDQELLEIAIIENVQRADLNAIDEGAAYRALMERFGHTQEQVATALGKSRSHVANQMRLLQLPADVQALVEEGRLTAGHARPLVGHPKAAELARRIAEKALSTRDAERLAKAPEPKGGKAPGWAQDRGAGRDGDTAALARDVGAALGLAVSIRHDKAKGRGRMTLAYKDLAQLNDILERLTAERG
jgi:ParB family chromosome partitioning protein